MIVNNNNITFGAIHKVFEIKGDNENRINCKLIQLMQDYGCKNRPLANKNVIRHQYNSKPAKSKNYNLDDKVSFWRTSKIAQKPVINSGTASKNEYFFIQTFWDNNKKRLGVIFADRKEDCENINFRTSFDKIINSLNEILSGNNGNNSSMKEVQKIDLNG